MLDERRRKRRKEIDRLQRQANKEYAIAQGTYVPRQRGNNKSKGG